MNDPSTRVIALNGTETAPFQNHTSFCVGTGRLDLGLHAEYQKQFLRTQELCRFQHIRGHGLFSEGMGIYQQRKEPDGTVTAEYCFTYLDRVFDFYREAGVRPFLELGFMPGALASGSQTVFYWRGNTTPPRDMDAWTDLVKKTLLHLSERYGADEVAAWPCEIWNEPNLPGFWENADKAKYLELYRATVRAVKEAVPAMRVGGPAICGGDGSQDWIRDFLTFCRDENVPVDFVTRHAYMGQKPERHGRYLYHRMCDPAFTVEEMRVSRGIIDSFPEFRGLPLYITEFNTSYDPFCPIHDTCLNAALTAGLLAQLGDVAQGYSYWTFGDVFEEKGIPPRLFHGGFGLMAEGQLEKPTAWTFSFFSRLRGAPLYRDENALVTRREDGAFEGILWNICRDKAAQLDIRLSLPAGKALYVCRTETVDEKHGNPLQGWLDMGQPASPDAGQRAFLKGMAQPLRETAVVTPEDARLDAGFRLAPNAVVYFEIAPVSPGRDEGYDENYYTLDREDH